MAIKIQVDDEKIAAFCQANGIRMLAFFGSVLRDDFGPDSDVDILIEFGPDAKVGMFKLALLEMQLSEILKRKVDLSTPGFLSEYFRDQVIREAEVQYVVA